MTQKLNPATLAPPVMGLYAQIAIAPAGRLAFIAGQVALDVDGNLVGGDSHAAQARQCFANIAAALDALSVRPERIVKMTINVVGHHPGLIAPIFGAGRDIFGDAWPVTASMLLGVQALGLPEWLVEVDAVVSLPD
ncbi:RidA family protein [Niveispirillum fermenti]|uniref:RidA family protein n=1 Tax=Niveispirillum fermenti TaxID=1233113 RepID=UPI003A8C7BC2